MRNRLSHTYWLNEAARRRRCYMNLHPLALGTPKAKGLAEGARTAIVCARFCRQLSATPNPNDIGF